MTTFGDGQRIDTDGATPHPAALAVPDKITSDDLYVLMLEEIDRAKITAESLRRRAGEEKIKSNRPSWLNAAAVYERRARMFEKIANLVDKAFSDSVMYARLVELKREEMAADSDGRDDGEGGGDE